MSPTSYQTAPPRIPILTLRLLPGQLFGTILSDPPDSLNFRNASADRVSAARPRMMVTLRKYLYGPWRANAAGEQTNLQAWVNLVLRMADSVEEYVLGAAADGDLREKLRSVRTILQSSEGEGATEQAADEFSVLVRSYRDRAAQTARAQSHDLYRILTTLNEALLLLAAGSTRTVGRLKQLETALERATSLNDMAALKSKLAGILTLVREEALQEHAESQRERSAIEQQIKQIRRGATWLRSDLPGRDEAIAAIGRLSQELPPPGEDQFFLVIFVLARLQEIVRRYGESAASDLVADLVHRRVNLPEGDRLAFRWSPEATVIAVRWGDGLEKLNELIEPQIETPFEHRLFLGSRLAVLRVGLNWVVLPVSRPAALLVEQIDRFIGGNA
jgi:hypothetical protein